ncbi:coadhesin-like [Nematostella vectensis]|uniref:coadhesin-like n=1 Tax=Nematostella vectensis TaxID=45351 RepID=UPI002077709E|nr:coadhesin-like [Nematostella vectensis]
MSAIRYLANILPLILVGFGFLVALSYVYKELSVEGGYSEWSNWSACTRSCGQGLRGRIRRCDKPIPGVMGKPCAGRNVNTEKCELKPCPQDGGFTEWGLFGDCDKSCGGGARTRKRECTNPAPAYGGKRCDGPHTDTMSCNSKPCPVNGGFSQWTEFSACELKASCGEGKKIRTRKCDNPVPAYDGKGCEGPHSEEAKCEVPCPTSPPTTQPPPMTNATAIPNTIPTNIPTTAKPAK